MLNNKKREYVKQLMDYGKKFIIIGNSNAVTYKEVFPLIKSNQLWLGSTKISEYKTYSGDVAKVFSYWYTNIEHKKRNAPLDLYRRYSNEYPHYANYDAIEVSKISDIPMDYDGVMAVPISILDVYCPEQFDILGYTHNSENSKGAVPFYKPLSSEELALCKKKSGFRLWTPMVIKNGEAKIMYPRIFIRKRKAK